MPDRGAGRLTRPPATGILTQTCAGSGNRTPKQATGILGGGSMDISGARRITALWLCLTLAACSVPRGAGFEAEVLAASERDANGEAVYDFEVHEVTRDTLPILARWPSVGTARSYSWIDASSQPASLLIAPGDTLSVVIWDAEENSLLTSPGQRVAQLQDVTVGSDGRIFIPFVGEMRVAGMAPGTARSRIEEELIATVPSAQVQVQVVPGRSNTANLVSGVNRPGVYPLPDRNTSVLAMIAEGGGVQNNMINPQVRLFRGRDVYGTSVAKLFENPALDTVLRGGDRVIVEPEERSFLSLGAANSQSVHLFPTDHVTALDALAIIGGVEENRADPQGILVLRQYPAHSLRRDGSGPAKDRVVFALNLTSADGLFSAGQFHIEPGDLVYATESPVTTARTVFGLIGAGVGLINDL